MSSWLYAASSLTPPPLTQYTPLGGLNPRRDSLNDGRTWTKVANAPTCWLAKLKSNLHNDHEGIFVKLHNLLF